MSESFLVTRQAKPAITLFAAVVLIAALVGFVGIGSKSAFAVTQSFLAGATGNVTIPAGVTEVTLTLIGADGQDGTGICGGLGGYGGRSDITYTVDEGDVLYVHVGLDGSDDGLNGGAFGNDGGGTGGGASDVRLNGDTLADRIAVAAGGGGGGASDGFEGNCAGGDIYGGDGGSSDGTIGIDGEVGFDGESATAGGGGGTSSAGGSSEGGGNGSLGFGGTGGSDSFPDVQGGGGGGGGYYGGGGGTAGFYVGGGGGAGSSFTGPDATQSTSQMTNDADPTVIVQYFTDSSSSTTTTTTTSTTTTSSTTTTTTSTTTTSTTTTAPSTTSTTAPVTTTTPEEDPTPPNDGDGNDDGVDDEEQDNVNTIMTHLDPDRWITIVLPEDCTNSEFGVMGVEEDLSAQDPEFEYRSDFFGFAVECPNPTITITMYYHGLDYTANDLLPRKYFPLSGTFITLEGASVTDTTIDGHPVVKLTYSITDGGKYDIDGEVNGAIVDPVGLAYSPAATGALPATGADAPLELGAAATLLCLGGALMLMATERKKLLS